MLTIDKAKVDEIIDGLLGNNNLTASPEVWYGLNQIKNLPQLSREGTTSDLISKTEAVEHLRRMLEATVPNTDYDEGFIDGVEFGISTVSTMPTIQPEPHWIPVERELPKESGYYITSNEYNGVTEDFYCDDYFWTADKNAYKVIAWMPLPEAYKSNNK